MRKYLAFTLLLVLIACNNNVYYKQSYVIDNASWAYDEQVGFEFEITDKEAYYDLVLELTHDVEYTYENVYVNIHTLFPSGEKVTDEVSLQLADKLDQWEGKCSAAACTVSILLQNNVFFKEMGQHKLEIEQFNRESPLLGIQKLELQLLTVE